MRPDVWRTYKSPTFADQAGDRDAGDDADLVRGVIDRLLLFLPNSCTCGQSRRAKVVLSCHPPWAICQGAIFCW